MHWKLMKSREGLVFKETDDAQKFYVTGAPGNFIL